jgi:hypothetical protein
MITPQNKCFAATLPVLLGGIYFAGLDKWLSQIEFSAHKPEK